MDLTDHAGRMFETGTYTLKPWTAHLWADASGNDEWIQGGSASEEDGCVPPLLGQLIAREAAGTSEFEAGLRDNTASDVDVFLGGHRYSFERPIRVDVTYRASAKVTEVRTPCNKLSIVTITYDVKEVDGTPAYEMETDLVVREDNT